MIRTIAQKVLSERSLLQLEALDHLWRGERELRLVKYLCARDKSAVDVGANIGIYTHFMSRVAAKVIAYEPNPVLAERLRRLFPSAYVHNVALSDRNGLVRLRMPVTGGRPHHELASISEGFDDASELMTFDVVATTLDSEGLDQVGFLKIDVEKHERQVLVGAIQTIQRSRPAIMTEVTPLLYEGDLRETFSFVTDLGYCGWFRVGRWWAPFDRFEKHVHADPENFGTPRFMSQNVLFFPEEMPVPAVLDQ